MVDPLAQAEAHLKQGRLAEAAKLYRGVLSEDPTNVEALSGLAAEALLRNSPNVARPLLARAAAIEPRNPDVFAAMARMHAIEGKPDEAEMCIATAAALAPGRLEFQIAQAMTSATKGDVPQALDRLQTLSARNPDSADLHQAIAGLLAASGNAEAAIPAFRRAIELDPAQPSPWHALGMLHATHGRPNEALLHLREALHRAPTDPAILIAMGELLLDQGDAAAAERLAREGAIVSPATAELPCLQGRALLALDRTAEALELIARTAKAAPGAASPLLVLGEAFLATDAPEKAVACARAVLAMPDSPTQVSLSAAGLLLRAGQPGDGWQAIAGLFSNLPEPGTNLRLRAPRSLADTLFFLRCVPLAAEHDARIALTGIPALAPLLTTVPGLEIDPGPPGDEDGDLMLLAACIQPTPEALPPLALTIPPRLRTAWQDAVDGYPGPRIAIAWGGPARLTLDEIRAAAPPGATLLSIVTGPAREDLAAHPDIVDAGWQLTGYPELAALLAAVDAVLLPDGPAAHLAAALSRPGVIYAPLVGGHLVWSGPWYPSVLVLRRWSAEAARTALDSALAGAEQAS